MFTTDTIVGRVQRAKTNACCKLRRSEIPYTSRHRTFRSILTANCSPTGPSTIILRPREAQKYASELLLYDPFFNRWQVALNSHKITIARQTKWKNTQPLPFDAKATDIAKKCNSNRGLISIFCTFNASKSRLGGSELWLIYMQYNLSLSHEWPFLCSPKKVLCPANWRVTQRDDVASVIELILSHFR